MWTLLKGLFAILFAAVLLAWTVGRWLLRDRWQQGVEQGITWPVDELRTEYGVSQIAHTTRTAESTLEQAGIPPPRH